MALLLHNSLTRNIDTDYGPLPHKVKSRQFPNWTACRVGGCRWVKDRRDLKCIQVNPYLRIFKKPTIHIYEHCTD
jgi:hypothetical protein